jgi:hypothetical protein
MKKTRFEVPTKVLTDQAQTALDQLAAPDNVPRLQLLNDEQGFDTKRFAKELAKANTALCTADADQEARKVDYLDEAHDDQSDAEAATAGSCGSARGCATTSASSATTARSAPAFASAHRPGRGHRARWKPCASSCQKCSSGRRNLRTMA